MGRTLDPNARAELLALTYEDITFDKLLDLFSSKSEKVNGKVVIKQPRIAIDDETVLKPGESFNKTQVRTTAGQIVWNKFIIESNFKDIVGYVNEAVDGGKMKSIENILSEALLNDRIETAHMVQFLDDCQWLSKQFHLVICGSFTMETLKPNPKVVKERERLVKENKAALDAGDAITASRIENDLIGVAKKELAGDHGLDLYNSGARGSFGNNYKNISVFRGPIYNPSTSGFDIATTTFMEGIKKEELFMFGNGIVGGAYPKAIGTATSGYFSKQINAALQAVQADTPGSDCKTKRVLDVSLNKGNFNDFKYRYIVDGGKLVLIDEEIGPKYFNKVVKMRSPQYCSNPNGKICSKCLGELYYKLKIKNVGLTGSRASSTLLNLSMKKFHDPSIKIYSVGTDNMLLSTDAKASTAVKESLDFEFFESLEESFKVTDKPVPSGRGFYIASPTQNLRVINKDPKQDYIIASQSKAFAACIGGNWDDEEIDIGVAHKGDTPTIEDIQHIVFNYDDVELNTPASLYHVVGQFNYVEYEGNLEIATDKPCRVIKEVKYNTWKEMMLDLGVVLKPM